MRRDARTWAGQFTLHLYSNAASFDLNPRIPFVIVITIFVIPLFASFEFFYLYLRTGAVRRVIYWTDPYPPSLDSSDWVFGLQPKKKHPSNSRLGRLEDFCITTKSILRGIDAYRRLATVLTSDQYLSPCLALSGASKSCRLSAMILSPATESRRWMEVKTECGTQE